MNIINKKARFNYELLEKLEVGISLIGSEARVLREKGADLSNSYAKILNGDVYLINSNITIEGKKDYDPTRSRRLLLHKAEITSIESKIKAKKLTLVPVRIYNKGRLVKVEIALAKPKRKFEKRELIKKRDVERELAQEFKNPV